MPAALGAGAAPVVPLGPTGPGGAVGRPLGCHLAIVPREGRN
ncbi:hypothetical protein STRTUCAR8_06153 [Streptomyces turgidiscabies Car8]|uniref:Uncharacterized protein n=1 Tax=Streptomyces turgidiscabies (strain Car8) TaxID=698760 RepID=L7F084_STRT8|nr:hypothetical protein STRTUCAR8_06153 [Streptomyces turgidiscabies Car8]